MGPWGGRQSVVSQTCHGSFLTLWAVLSHLLLAINCGFLQLKDGRLVEKDGEVK